MNEDEFIIEANKALQQDAFHEVRRNKNNGEIEEIELFQKEEKNLGKEIPHAYFSKNISIDDLIAASTSVTNAHEEGRQAGIKEQVDVFLGHLENLCEQYSNKLTVEHVKELHRSTKDFYDHVFEDTP